MLCLYRGICLCGRDMRTECAECLCVRVQAVNPREHILWDSDTLLHTLYI